ncbi:DUF3127 domain-containing protein [Spirosoma sp. BT702]|uniref:DUF3127 domain-containing protein n=1 Tax=Spirosoma profusum TaxID=2771354 RepID=A0A927AUR3_9BACT|nr:DUF3127 domain-containing protein [Spirosoma profusum]MBD2704775.1 DUF3127 domain-containing protein [Spirosoma profusum]
MAFEVVGKLIKVLPEVTGQGKNGAWNKQEFVLETLDSQYPKKVCMSIWGEKASDLKQFADGDMLKATFSAESREYNDRWYTELRAFRLELAESGNEGGYVAPTRPATQPQSAPTRQNQPTQAAFNAAFDEESNDLPF